jgi:hypothetical protein
MLCSPSSIAADFIRPRMPHLAASSEEEALRLRRGLQLDLFAPDHLMRGIEIVWTGQPAVR